MVWHPSREDCIVLNVDDNCFQTSRSEAGGMLRKGNGDCIMGFSSFIGNANNTHVELLAIFLGVKLAKSIGRRVVCC